MRIDYIISAIVVAVVVAVFTISPSPSPSTSKSPTVAKKINNKENLTKPTTKKVEKSRSDMNIAHKSYLPKNNDKVKSKQRDIEEKREHKIEQINTEVDKNIIDNADDDQELVSEAIGKNNIKPLYKKWKKNGNELYNIYTTTPQKSEQSNSFAPPQIPSLVTVRVGNKPVTVAIPAKAKAYIVTKEDGEVKSEPIDSSNSQESLIAPPAVGQ